VTHATSAIWSEIVVRPGGRAEDYFSQLLSYAINAEEAYVNVIYVWERKAIAAGLNRRTVACLRETALAICEEGMG
jgi:hypothetical protein